LAATAAGNKSVDGRMTACDDEMAEDAPQASKEYNQGAATND
jgi:hypothetical protein